jgi:hypothetical protein
MSRARALSTSSRWASPARRDLQLWTLMQTEPPPIDGRVPVLVGWLATHEDGTVARLGLRASARTTRSV